MKFVFLSALAVLIGYGGLLEASENTMQGFPPKFSTGTIQYKFDQTVLEKSLLRLSNALSKELKSESSKRDAAKVKTLKINLTLAIAAAGQYANAESEVKSILKKIINDLDLANEPTPEGFLEPQSLFYGMAAQAFVDSEGVPPDVNIESMGEANFGHLAANAYRMIETRSSIKLP